MEFTERNALLKTLASNAGLRLPQTRVPEGDSLLPIGEENKRKMQCEVAQLPSLSEGLVAMYERIKLEDHKDVGVPIQHVRMDPVNGGLFGEGSTVPPLAYTNTGFSHVTQFVKPPTIRNGFNENLLALPPELRATVFNHHAKNAVRKAGSDVWIRTAKDVQSGRRVVRAVTSDKHSLSMGDDLTIIGALNNLPKGAKLRVTRELDRTDFEIIWPAMDRQLVVGDVALMALTISNSETKGLSLKVSPKLLRVLCYNFTTAYTEGGEQEISLKHIGDIGRKLPAAIQQAQRTLEPFILAFSDAYREGFDGKTRGEVLTILGKKFPELSESTLTASAALWDADGARGAGDTFAGLANALTRASQEQSMADASTTERIAGRVIVQGWGALA